MTEYFTIGNAGELEYVLPKPRNIFKKVFRAYYSSPEQWAASIECRDKSKAWNMSGWSPSDEGWYGSKNIEEAINLARYGWKEGNETVDKVINRIHAMHPIRFEPIKYGIAGTHPNVPRAISGNPINMHLPDLTKAKRRNVITLLSDMGGNANYSSSEFCNRAAVIAGMVDAIEAKGYSCDVLTYCISVSTYVSEDCSEPVKLNTMCACMVKQSHQPIDIPRLAFGLGHSSMFRRFSFIDEGSFDFNNDLGNGLGCASTLQQCCNGLPELRERNIFTLVGVKGSDGAFKTIEIATTTGLKLLTDSLAKQGFPLYVK